MVTPGDIVLLEFPYTNRVGSKVRPGLVVGRARHERFGDLTITYMTAEIDSYGLDHYAVQVTDGDLSEGKIKQDSVIRIDKVITVHPDLCRKVARFDFIPRSGVEILPPGVTASRCNN